MAAKEPLKIEIRIPFCAGNCVFCDEHTYGENIGSVNRYRVALEKEIAASAEDLEDFAITSVHLRGGSLSVLGYGSMENLIDIIQRKIPSSDTTQWVADLMPSEIDEMNLSILKQHGIRHICCGIMGMNKEELRELHRPYTMNLVENGLKQIKDHGEFFFAEELVFGIPGQTAEKLQDNIRTLLDTAPVEIRLTRFHDRTRGLREQREYAERVDWHTLIRAAEEILIPAGFERIGSDLVYARDGMAFVESTESDSSLMGFGIGAETRMDGMRYHNTHDMDKYREHSDSPELIAVIDRR